MGHFFIPPDRLFGNLEQEFQKTDVIEKPEIYIDIMKKNMTIIHLGGEDCPIWDWKSYADGQIKELRNWLFKFVKTKQNYYENQEQQCVPSTRQTFL